MHSFILFIHPYPAIAQTDTLSAVLTRHHPQLCLPHIGRGVHRALSEQTADWKATEDASPGWPSGRADK